jgi:hypothetical protein
MTISATVNEYLDEAKSNLRSALVAAARNETPDVVIYISKIIKEIENLEKIEIKKEFEQKMQDTFMKKFIDGSGNMFM